MPPDTYFPMWELLMRHGIDPDQARSLAVSGLRHWELDDVENFLNKVKRPSPDYCLFKSDEVKATTMPTAEDDITPFHKWWPSLWESNPQAVGPPRAMVEQSAKEGSALCVNVKGEWSLRTDGYVALSHVWMEGLQREEIYGGLEKTKVVKVFELLKRAGLHSEWIWTDVLVIPGGGPAASIADELLTSELINSMPDVYGRAEAVLIFDALVLQLHSTDSLDVVIGLACGKWATRVWTYQEIKLASRAVVVTAIGSIEFSDMIADMKNLEAVDNLRYHALYIWVAIMASSDQYRLTIRDLVTACGSRSAGTDIDYARAFFPVLGLKWVNGMTREQGMQVIYRSLPQDTLVIASFAGSPRMKLEPAWAPSYLTRLEGSGGNELQWESRGIRGEWYVLKINSLMDTTRPKFGKIGFNLKVDCDVTPTLQIITAPTEHPEVLEAVKSMIGRGLGYILSVNTFATYSKEWARSVLIVEKAETAAYHGMEVAVHCSAVIGTPGEHREEKMSLLIRHCNPNVNKDLDNQLRYHWFCENETSKPSHLPQQEGENMLHAAVRNGDITKVKTLIEDGDLIDSFDSHGLTPLHTAAARGTIAILEVLAQKTTNIEQHCKDATRDTPLILAARRGQAGSVKVLLDCKADIENRNGGDYTALMCAAYECHEEAVAVLLERKANPNARDKGGFSGSPLLLASGRNNLGIDTMKLLIQYGADVNPTFHPLAWTPLLKASDMGNDEEVEYLLSVGGDANVKDTSHNTPLRHAIFHARERSVRILLDADANREAILDKHLRPVHIAATCGNYKIMQMLLEEEIDVNVRAGESLDGKTALHMAVSKQEITVVKLLLNKGADVNAQTTSGKSALDYSIAIADKTLQGILKSFGGKEGTRRRD